MNWKQIVVVILKSLITIFSAGAGAYTAMQVG